VNILSGKDSKYSSNKISELHPKFIEAIREASPLAVLGSLCIAISAFTSQNFPDAQPFAITAATLFLIAFSFSIIFKITSKTVYASLFAVISYVATAMAITMLFGALFFFGSTLTLLNTSVLMILPITEIVFSIVLGLFIWDLGNTLKKKTKVLPAHFKILHIASVISTFGMVIVGVAVIFNTLIPEIIDQSFSARTSVTVSALFFTLILASFLSTVKAIKDFDDKVKRKNHTIDDELVGCQY
jgi:hypothetical protein